VLDPSIFCGTGTPEAGGVTFKELLEAVGQLHQLDIVGCDINELAPHYDLSGASTAAACKITREIILQIAKRGQ
jgi:agmatinase